MNEDDLKIIPELLHDARLIGLKWIEGEESLALRFDCLRRGEDGSRLGSVELTLAGVSLLAAFYNPALVEQRLSEFNLENPLEIDDDSLWRDCSEEAWLSFNSKDDLFDFETAWRQVRLFGNTDVGQVHPYCILKFDPRQSVANQAYRCMFIGFTALTVQADGLPLSVERWGAEFEAWWSGWDEHWDAKSGDEFKEPVEEDTFIPVGQDEADLNYKPPQRAAFLVNEDVPEELLAPIRDYHEGALMEDWGKMASAWPDFDMSLEEKREQIKASHLSHEWGRWVYIRQIDDWWQEASHACVVCRGVEHTAPDEESPAENEETVITYGLRCSDTGWVLRTYSQGWPAYKSAPKSLKSTPWMSEWRTPTQR